MDKYCGIISLWLPRATRRSKKMSESERWLLEMCDRGKTNSRFDFEKGKLKRFLDEGLIRVEKVHATSYRIYLTDKGREVCYS